VLGWLHQTVSHGQFNRDYFYTPRILYASESFNWLYLYSLLQYLKNIHADRDRETLDLMIIKIIMTSFLWAMSLRHWQYHQAGSNFSQFEFCHCHCHCGGRGRVCNSQHFWISHMY